MKKMKRLENSFIIPTDTCYWVGCFVDDVKWYKEVFTLKQRPNNKLLSVVLPCWNDLGVYTGLADEEMTFLRDYDEPFTCLCKPSDQLREMMHLEIRPHYSTVGIRIQETCVLYEDFHKKRPYFLTSLNITNDSECYSREDIVKQFKWYDFQTNLPRLPKNPPSDIFRFVNGEVEYVRKSL